MDGRETDKEGVVWSVTPCKLVLGCSWKLHALHPRACVDARLLCATSVISHRRPDHRLPLPLHRAPCACGHDTSIHAFVLSPERALDSPERRGADEVAVRVDRVVCGRRLLRDDRSACGRVDELARSSVRRV